MDYWKNRGDHGTNCKGGRNLYEGAKIDYKLQELKLEGLANLLIGKEVQGKEMKSNEEENVILFWSGHGDKGGGHPWEWGDRELLTGSYLRTILSEMSERKRFRKLCLVVETCFAGEGASQCVGIPGVVMLTAANEREPSLPTGYSLELETYRTNSFSHAFLNLIQKQPRASLHELYTTLYNETLGSHVKLYNVEYYGNLFKNKIEEFIVVQ